MERKVITDLYIRVCKDSGFELDCIEAAKLVANILTIDPFQVWEAMGTFSVMQRCANGTHPEVFN